MSDAIAELKRRFNPRRTYLSGNTTIEVDGGFLRVDDEITHDGESLLVPLEDFLQDPAIIRSARISTGRDTAEVGKRAAGMIGKLYDEYHVTPFESGVEFRTKVTTPIYAAQPFFQVFSAGNEFSGRYSEIDGPFATPPYAEKSPHVAQLFQEAAAESKQLYHQFQKQGIANEQARFALLYRFFTEFYWKVSLRHLLDVCALEENLFAPPEFWEARDNILIPMLKDWVPWTYDAFCENRKILKTRWACDVPMEEINKWLWHQNMSNVGWIRLLDYQAREDIIRRGVHTGPDPKRGFGHSLFSLEMSYPISTHRQWVRHRHGTWSELPVDFDAVVANRDFYVPMTFCKQVGKPMEYKFEDMIGGENGRAQDDLNRLITKSTIRYDTLRNLGLEPRQAATVLPYTFRVSALWSGNMESLMNFFSLRCDEHAQAEIRAFAEVIYSWFGEQHPWSNKIFLDHLNYGKSKLFDALRS